MSSPRTHGLALLSLRLCVPSGTKELLISASRKAASYGYLSLRSWKCCIDGLSSLSSTAVREARRLPSPPLSYLVSNTPTTSCANQERSRGFSTDPFTPLKGTADSGDTRSLHSPSCKSAWMEVVCWDSSAVRGIVKSTSPASSSSAASIPYPATAPSLLSRTWGQRGR